MWVRVHMVADPLPEEAGRWLARVQRSPWASEVVRGSGEGRLHCAGQESLSRKHPKRAGRGLAGTWGPGGRGDGTAGALESGLTWRSYQALCVHVGQPRCDPQRGLFEQKALFGLVRRHILKALRCSGSGCTWGCLHLGPGRAFPK